MSAQRNEQDTSFKGTKPSDSKTWALNKFSDKDRANAERPVV